MLNIDEFVKRWKYKIKQFANTSKIKPVLAIIQVGTGPAAESLIRDCEEVGIVADLYNFPEYTPIGEIRKKTKRIKADGILLITQRFSLIDRYKIYDEIDLRRDVAGFKPSDIFKNCKGEAIIEWLDYCGFRVEGSKILILGKNGGPIAESFVDRNACVTVMGNSIEPGSRQNILREADLVVTTRWYANELKTSQAQIKTIILDGGEFVEDDDDTGYRIYRGVDELERCQIMENVCKAFTKFNPYRIIEESENEFEMFEAVAPGNYNDDDHRVWAKRQYVAEMLAFNIGEEVADEYCKDYGIDRVDILR